MPKIKGIKETYPPVQPLTKEYDDDTLSYSDSEIELTEYEKNKPKKVKAVKPKTEYIMTDGRKANFEKARLKRAENIAIKKQIKLEEESKLKNEMEKKLLKKANNLKKKVESKKKVLDDIVSDGESEDEKPSIIVKRKKRPQVIYLDEDTEDEKPQVIVKRRPKTVPVQEPVAKPQPTIPKRMIQFL